MREHLRAGTRAIKIGRAHHSDDIPGYYEGKRGMVKHGQAYPSGLTNLIEYHGLTDNLTGPDHEKAIAAAKRRLAGKMPVRFQKLSEEYKKPSTGY